MFENLSNKIFVSIKTELKNKNRNKTKNKKEEYEAYLCSWTGPFDHGEVRGTLFPPRYIGAPVLVCVFEFFVF